MGITTELFAVSDATRVRLAAAPALVWSLLAPDDPAVLAQALREVPPASVLGRLFGRGAPAAPPPAPLALSPGEGLVAALDKAWHGLHYLFTGTAWAGAPPLNFLAAGGTELVHPSLNNATVRLFDATATRAIAGALAACTVADLQARFDPAAMTTLGIYPTIWDRALDPDDDDDPLGYCVEYFARLQDGVARAAADGHGLMVHTA